VLPGSAHAESLVGPTRRGPGSLASFDEFIAGFAIRIEPLSREVARRTAALRARHPRLRLPDALVLATGDVLDAALILTADAAWQSVSPRVQVI
jgi:hypothetical protein